MKKTMKKGLSWLLVALLLLTVFPLTGFADSSDSGRIVLEPLSDNTFQIVATEYYGLISLEINLTASGIRLTAFEDGADAGQALLAGNEFTFAGNPENGKAGGFFRYELWTADAFLAAAEERGETLSEDFDPGRFVLGIVTYEPIGEPGETATVSLSGSVNTADGKEDAAASLEIVLPAAESPDDPEPDDPTEALSGDLNGDGLVGAMDARYALRAAVGLEEPDAASRSTADVDGDDRITSADARLILRGAVGLEAYGPSVCGRIKNEEIKNGNAKRTVRLKQIDESNISVTAVNLIGLQGFDLVLEADGITLKNVKQSADYNDTSCADNPLASDKNRENGFFAGYFKEQNWDRATFAQKAEESGETVSDSFDPENLSLGTVKYYAIDGFAGMPSLTVRGYLYLEGGETISVCQTLKLPTSDYWAGAVPGDVDRDGVVGAMDARYALRAAVGLEEPDALSCLAADMDSDDRITSADARLILRCAVGLEGFGITVCGQIKKTEISNGDTKRTIRLELIDENNISLTAVNLIGLQGFDLVLEADGITMKNVKQSADYNDTCCADNPLSFERNKDNGFFAGYFKEQNWDRATFAQKAEDLGETVSASFDPENLSLGTVVFQTDESFSGDPSLTVRGYLYLEGGKTISVCQTLALPKAETPDDPTEALLGDLNGDGIVGAMDARYALRAAVRLEESDAEADVDCDGRISAADARLILRGAVRLEAFGPTVCERIKNAEIKNGDAKRTIRLELINEKNISVTAVNLIGLQGFDLVLEADGITLKNVKQSADYNDTCCADNPLSSERNKDNGFFAGYFKEQNWDRATFAQKAEDLGETVSDSFDPENLSLGTVVFQTDESFSRSPSLTVKGYLYLEGGKTISVCQTLTLETLHEHAFGDWTVTRASTCTEKGEETRTCACGEKETREIAALGHQEVEVNGKAATCAEKGLTEGKVCERCGAVLTAQAEIPALGHKEKTVAGKAATCTEAGLTAGRVCERCGAVFTAQTEIPALPHAWDAGTVTTEPTTEKEGVRTFTCTVCKGTKTEPVEKLIKADNAKENKEEVFAKNEQKTEDVLKNAGEGAKIVTKDGKGLETGMLVGSGMKIVKADGTEKVIVVKGDNDGDGKVTASDARTALRMAVDLPTDNGGAAWEKEASLVNGGDKVTAKEARSILRGAVGLEKPVDWFDAAA